MGLAGFRDSLDMSGRDILLPASLAFDLALILHELATNSAKFGALAVEGGRSRLSWQINPQGEAGILMLEWTDEDGVGRAAAGGRQGGGFGRRLISGLVERKWNGTITITQEDGYRFVATIPIPAVAPDEFGA